MAVAMAMGMGMATSSCSVMASPVLTSSCFPNSQITSSLPFPRAGVRVHALSLSLSTTAKTRSPNPGRERTIIRPQIPTQTPSKPNPHAVRPTRDLTTCFALTTPTPTPTPTATETEVCAIGRFIPMSAHKARRVIDQIRGRSYAESLMILELMPYRACYPILKLVYSAAANANHNMGFNEGSLIISRAEVNEGKTVKKLKPRARGRGFAIRRSSCHITIVLKDVDLEEKY